MRFDSIKARGLGPFANEVSIDLSAIDGRIVAVTGQNGAGKSTLLELLAAGLFRTTPTRGSLTDLATSRDAYVEVKAVNGAAYTFRHTIDGTSGKGESLVLNGAGLPVLASAKVREFDVWAKSHLPSPEVLFASTFMPQGSGGFLELKEGDRKAVLLRTLGIERLEKLAEDAREQYRAAKAGLATLDARIADEQARGESVEAAVEETEFKRRALALAEEELGKARIELAAALEEQRQLVAEYAKRESLEADRARLEAEALDVERKMADSRARINNANQVAERETEVRAVADRVKELERAIAERSSEEALELQRAESLEQQAKAHEQASADLNARIKANEAKIAGLMAREVDVRAKLTNNQWVLDQAEEIRAAVARETELAAKRAELDSIRDAALQVAKLLDAECGAAKARLFAEQGHHSAADARIRAARQRLTSKAAVEVAVASLPELAERCRLDKSALANAQATLEELRNQRVVGAEERIGGLRDALGTIAALSSHTSPSELAADALDADDATVLRAQSLPAEIREWVAAVETCVAALAASTEEHSKAERLAARAGEMEQAAAELTSALAEKLAASMAIEEANSAAATAYAAANVKRDEAKATAKELDVIFDEQTKLAPVTKLAKHLDQAEARIAELTPQIASIVTDKEAAALEAKSLEGELNNADGNAFVTASSAAEAREKTEELHSHVVKLRSDLRWCKCDLTLADVIAAKERASHVQEQLEAQELEFAALQSRIAEVPAPGSLPAMPHIATFEAAVQTWEGEARKAHSSLAIAAAREVDAMVRRDKLLALNTDRCAIEEELGDWERLAQDLGRDGLQAAEIDCAGPELTELINDLLRTCVGSRWTVSVETTRQSADGKKQIEGCDVRVLDTERGRDASAESLSGGERVIVGEAISLALAMLATRRSGVQGCTLVRDETGAALDPANARAYVAMLRRSADLVGASRVLFVSHNAETQELADARIVISNGTVEVQ